MHEQYIYFADKNLADFDLYITGAGQYEIPSRKYEAVQVPGRNGDLIIDHKKFDNVPLWYPAIVMSDKPTNFGALTAFLLSKNGYMKLSDTYDPDVFYMATFDRIEDAKTYDDYDKIKCRIYFNRKPQKFLKSGEHSFTAPSMLINPTEFNALPLIRLYGSGTLIVNDISVTLATEAAYVDLDCDLQEILQEGENVNLTTDAGKFPYLIPGANTISYTGTNFEVIPRWFTI